MPSVFSEFNFGERTFGSEDDTPTLENGRVGWRFFDGSTEYVLPVNPSQASMYKIEKLITAQQTISGRTIYYEGRPQITSISFSGVILEEDQLRAFESWFQLRKQIRITDDLNQSYWVYLLSFQPKRVNKVDTPWYHEYSAEAKILNRGSTV